MAGESEVWEILGIRQLAATDERAEEFRGTLLVHRSGTDQPVEMITVHAKRSILADLEGYLSRLLQRSRGLPRR